MSLKQGSMREAFNNIYQRLINDETLLRLLYYPPKSRNNPDPLDPSLPNLVNPDSPEYWDLVNERIVLGEKTTDLEDEPLCRLYLHAGRRRPVYDNYLLASQEVILSIFTHESYERDIRSLWISDVLNELLVHEPIAGYGKLEYTAGNPMAAPLGYKHYRHVYRFADNKK